MYMKTACFCWLQQNWPYTLRWKWLKYNVLKIFVFSSPLNFKTCAFDDEVFFDSWKRYTARIHNTIEQF